MANASSGCNVALFLWDAYGCFVLHMSFTPLLCRMRLQCSPEDATCFWLSGGKYRSGCGGAGLLITSDQAAPPCFISGLEHDAAIPHSSTFMDYSWAAWHSTNVQQPVGLGRFQSNVLGGWHVRYVAHVFKGFLPTCRCFLPKRYKRVHSGSCSDSMPILWNYDELCIYIYTYMYMYLQIFTI